LIPCPGITVSKRSIELEDKDGQGQKGNCSGLADYRILLQTKTSETEGNKVKHLRKSHDGEIKSWEVMVKEELAGHEIEGKVMEGPSE